MPTIPIHLSDQEYNFLTHYAHATNSSLAELLRVSTLKTIENKIDITVYETTLEKYHENPHLSKTEELASMLRNEGSTHGI